MKTAEQKQRTHYLLPPPRLMPNGEMAAVIEPPLRDMLPFPGEGDVGEWEHFESGPGQGTLSVEATRRALAAATRDERVAKLLEGKRHIAIGVSRRETREKPEGRRVTLVAVFYNYETDLAIEATLDADGKTVVAVASSRSQPAPLQSEIDRAIQLAAGHEKIADHLRAGLVANAIVVPDIDPTSPAYNHRCLDVRFFCAEERLARLEALVDLSAERVLRAGSCRGDGCCGGHDSAEEGRAS